jgi:hypothetical protein
VSNTVLWGTAIAPAERTLRRWATDEGDLMVTDEGDQIMFYRQPVKVTYKIVTDEGDYLVTDEGDNIVAVVGDAGPGYFKTSEVTNDGEEPFVFRFQTNPWQPVAQGGENIFSWAFISVAWSMSGTIRVTPTVDGKEITETLDDGTVVSVIRTTFELDQQDGTMQRVNRIFPVPLAMQYVKDGVTFTRTALRGERLQLLIESTSDLGVGELMLNGIQVEYEPVRKATYATVDSTSS